MSAVGATWDPFGPSYDLPPYPSPPRAYLIATTPRSGSHFLGHLLRATGQLGAPLEYFKPDRIATWQALHGLASAEDAIARLLQLRTSPSGWFGVKAHGPDYELFAESGLAARFPAFERIVHTIRRDRVAQAVSLSVAQQTGAWISFHRVRGQARYDFAAIHAALRGINSDALAWQARLEVSAVPRYTVVYEELVADPKHQVQALLTWFGLDPDVAGDPCFDLMPARQAKPSNLVWAQRFTQDFVEVYGQDALVELLDLGNA